MTKILRHMKNGEVINPDPIKEGLVLWYDFVGMRNSDSNRGIAHDWSGNGNHGTLQNFNYTAESGYDKNKLLFDGIDDKLQIPDLLLNETGMSAGVNGKVYSYEDDKVVTVGEEGIEVGGRNLIRNSEEFHKPLGTNFSVISKGIPTSGIYTISFSTEVIEDNTDFNVQLVYIGRFVERADRNDEGRTSATFMVEESDINKNVFLYFGSGSAESRQNEGKFFNVKLEKGNKATDWTPAPEDFQTTSLSPSSLSNLQLYNRPLTPEEVAHNYAIEKERFGIE